LKAARLAAKSWADKSLERGMTGSKTEQASGGSFPTSEKKAERQTRSGARRPEVGQYLFVPYEERNQAYDLGAWYDGDKKAWYVPLGEDAAPFSKWTSPAQIKSDTDIQNEFMAFCEDLGLVFDNLPEMDGQWHGVPVSTSRSTSAKKGRYILERVETGGARGHAMNNDNGASEPWVLKGEMVSEQDREKARQLMEENRRQREQQQQQEYLAVSAACTARWNRLNDADDQHKYLVRKGVKAFGLRQEGDKLVTPIRDENGVIWSLQTIDPAGNKLYVGGGQKSGNFHILGDFSAGKTVLFGEGYATCASLHMATGLPVVEVYDASNIEPVLASLKQRLAGKDVIICGDDDILTHDRVFETINNQIKSEFAISKLKLSAVDRDEVVADGNRRQLRANPDCSIRLGIESNAQGVDRIIGVISNSATKQAIKLNIVNLGREKALSAAEKYDAKAVIFPIFKSLEGRPTDFNDLADREGQAAVRRQVGRAMMMERAAKLPEPTSLELAKAVLGSEATIQSALADRQYVGPVVGKTSAHLVQDIGRSTAVEHNLAKLDRVPQVGQRAKITYAGERGAVQQLSTGREGVSR
jgi:putative DNA primase/helicase